MEYSSEAHLDCLLVSSRYPPNLRSVAVTFTPTGFKLKRVGIDRCIPMSGPRIDGFKRGLSESFSAY
jgi:hypothetical protein